MPIHDIEDGCMKDGHVIYRLYAVCAVQEICKTTVHEPESFVVPEVSGVKAS